MKKILIIVLACLTTGVNAESTQQNGVYLYPHVTGYNYDRLFSINPETDEGVGLGIGYQFDNNWAVEIAYDPINTETSTGIEMDTKLLQVNSLYRFTSDSNWQPIFLVGVGHIEHEIFSAPATDPAATTINLGTGLEYVASEHITLRADVRGVHQLDHDATDVMTTVGINIMFGGNKIPLDSDNDGVPNARDKCPNTAANTAVNDQGCDLDSDNDGVANAQDQCPETPKGAAVDGRGCALDSDGDGIADYQDKCASTPAGARVDKNGCRLVLKETVEIKLNVNFDSNSATVKPEYYGQIAKVARFMREYPDTEVTIEGHTDSTGAAWYNKRLSQKRAQAIADSLVNQYQIAPNRVKAIGYGLSKPIADNRTEVGRKLNRRVVAQIRTTVSKPQ